MPDARLDFEEMLVQEATREAVGAKEVIRHTGTTMAKQFDTRAVIADLTAIETKCTELVNEANALEIKTKAQNMEAVNISGKLQNLGKQVAKKCVDFLEPYKRVIAAINGPKKRITDAADKAKSIVNQKILQFKKQEEIEAAKQQKLIDEASKKLQESLNEQAKEIGIEAPQVAPIKAPKPVLVLRGDSGASVYSRKKWKCEIVDSDKVPMFLHHDNKGHRLCLPSQKLLNQAVNMGVRFIPGCRIFEDETPVTRSA